MKKKIDESAFKKRGIDELLEGQSLLGSANLIYPCNAHEVVQQFYANLENSTTVLINTEIVNDVLDFYNTACVEEDMPSMSKILQKLYGD